MKVNHIRYPDRIDRVDCESQAMSIGFFDGVHQGHQSVIHKSVSAAKEHGIKSAVMTFHPHPKEVLGKLTQVHYLTPLPAKLELIESLGVDAVYVVHFDKAFAQVSPDEFVTNMLIPMRCHTVVVGYDFTFGHKGAGTAHTLKRSYSDRMNVEIVPPFVHDNQTVSSTHIRELVQSGQIERAALLLGRSYSVRGTVTEGRGRGRQIGFPTANLELSEPYVVPSNGVYAVKVNVSGHRYDGVMNIGVKPTFSDRDPDRTLEAHLLQFSGDLYGKQLEIEFISFLRQERRFPSVDMLIEQIGTDIEQAKSVFS